MRQLSDGPQDSAGLPRLQPGYYLEDAELVSIGEDGAVQVRLQASEAVQRLADGAVELQTVSVRYDPADNVPWHLQATVGRMPADGKIIELLGNVVATTRNGTRVPTVIRTDYLEIDPDTGVAFTDRQVDIEYGDSWVKARGMRVFLREDRFQLLANVNGIFTPD